eukprot:CAMPEP_0202954566 /NCGR_PEP_ID=MMETSP1395-20130829/50918_1 /ASSEMBLY_ACC=CAM_ASM_000871 /TAXON_ID=5961 /ORGANISM="Blepharisma japonicum, Strain Stock R1072" /LENGTH=167 /DNA_ID=CAMNT_0049670179 /DNA_START=390 /DNA_END=893 /DNA_ORIENTATION=+
MTVAYMIEKLKEGNHTSVIINAAASALGRMLIRWCKLLSITTVNLVRRQEQADILASIGAEHVFNTSDDGWKDAVKAVTSQLGSLASIGAEHVFNTSDDGWKDAVKAVTSQLGTKIGFDAIAGSSTQDMLDLLANEGVVHVYGGLSGQPVQASPMSLIGGDKTVKGL